MDVPFLQNSQKGGKILLKIIGSRGEQVIDKLKLTWLLMYITTMLQICVKGREWDSSMMNQWEAT